MVGVSTLVRLLFPKQFGVGREVRQVRRERILSDEPSSELSERQARRLQRGVIKDVGRLLGPPLSGVLLDTVFLDRVVPLDPAQPRDPGHAVTELLGLAILEDVTGPLSERDVRRLRGVLTRS